MLLWSDVCDCIKMDAFLVVALLKCFWEGVEGYRAQICASMANCI